MEKIKVGIVGAAGYTAGELIRILIYHPYVGQILAQSESQTGKEITQLHTDLIGDFDGKFVDEIMPSECDVVFLCKGHGQSQAFLDAYPEFLATKIIDLSQDFRLKGSHDFVYGLPEFQKEAIKSSHHIANPGCFATAIQLAILPAIEHDQVLGDLHLSGITGSTGAGQSFSDTTHFSWRNGNASMYKGLNHQHMLEVGEMSSSVNNTYQGNINFIPYRGAFTRGIIVTSYFETEANLDQLIQSYSDVYDSALFTHRVENNPDIKMVVNTNKGLVFVTKQGTQAVVVSVIDNLLKGASGQAVQNMNLIFGFAEDAGLKLKGSSF